MGSERYCQIGVTPYQLVKLSYENLTTFLGLMEDRNKIQDRKFISKKIS